MFNLSNKVAIITGSGSGIGQSIAELLGSQGAQVHVWERDKEKGEQVVSGIRKKGGNAWNQVCNVADGDSVQQAMKEVADISGRLDVLVNNAGIAHIGNVENTQPEDFNRILDVNVKGVYHCMQAAVPYMKERGGSIINMASVVATVGIPDRFAYSMSKGAVLTMTLSAATDLMQYDIRVNCISPARIHTPFVDGYLAANYPGQEKEMFEKLSQTQPIGRMGQPAEVAAMVMYLASDEASFITGSNFPIDGGFTTVKK